MTRSSYWLETMCRSEAMAEMIIFMQALAKIPSKLDLTLVQNMVLILSCRIQGNDGDDTIILGLGNDEDVYGEYCSGMSQRSNYRLCYGLGVGGEGNDLIRGGAGNDLNLHGDGGQDELYGGTGNDELYGDDGDDVLNGGEDDDTLTGGGGSDIFVFGSNDGQDTIEDLDTTLDKIEVPANASVSIEAVESDTVLFIDNTVVTLKGVQNLELADLNIIHPTVGPTTLTLSPTNSPTLSPSRTPSQTPTETPTEVPSNAPSIAATEEPTTQQPTATPSRSPSSQPTASPSRSPSSSPTTPQPTASPSASPTTSEPTASPSRSPTTPQPTNSPSRSPSSSPTTSEPAQPHPSRLILRVEVLVVAQQQASQQSLQVAAQPHPCRLILRAEVLVVARQQASLQSLQVAAPPHPSRLQVLHFPQRRPQQNLLQRLRLLCQAKALHLSFPKHQLLTSLELTSIRLLRRTVKETKVTICLC